MVVCDKKYNRCPSLAKYPNNKSYKPKHITSGVTGHLSATVHSDPSNVSGGKKRKLPPISGQLKGQYSAHYIIMYMYMPEFLPYGSVYHRWCYQLLVLVATAKK